MTLIKPSPKVISQPILMRKLPRLPRGSVDFETVIGELRVEHNGPVDDSIMSNITNSDKRSGGAKFSAKNSPRSNRITGLLERDPTQTPTTRSRCLWMKLKRQCGIENQTPIQNSKPKPSTPSRTLRRTYSTCNYTPLNGSTQSIASRDGSPLIIIRSNTLNRLNDSQSIYPQSTRSNPSHNDNGISSRTNSINRNLMRQNSSQVLPCQSKSPLSHHNAIRKQDSSAFIAPRKPCYNKSISCLGIRSQQIDQMYLKTYKS